MKVIYYYNVIYYYKVLIIIFACSYQQGSLVPQIKYHNDPAPTPPCSMLFSQGYCLFLGGAQGWGGGEGELFAILVH